MTTATQKQHLLEAVAILKTFNIWRRGEDDDSPMPAGEPDPKQIGLAIDTVVELVPVILEGLLHGL